MEIITAEEAMLMGKPEGTDEALELIMNTIKKEAKHTQSINISTVGLSEEVSHALRCTPVYKLMKKWGYLYILGSDKVMISW